MSSDLEDEILNMHREEMFNENDWTIDSHDKDKVEDYAVVNELLEGVDIEGNVTVDDVEEFYVEEVITTRRMFTYRRKNV